MNMQPVCRIDSGACVLWAILLFVLPLQWVGAILTAGFFHELCHLAAVIGCGGSVTDLKIGLTGAKITAWGLRPRGAFLATLAGPCGGLLLVLLKNRFPRLAFCALAQSLFNLLPIMPLDGGKMLGIVLRRLWPNLDTERILQRIARMICLIFLLIGVWAAAVNLGYFPLCFGIWLNYQAGFRKIPCKPGIRRVQ